MKLVLENSEFLVYIHVQGAYNTCIIRIIRTLATRPLFLEKIVRIILEFLWYSVAR